MLAGLQARRGEKTNVERLNWCTAVGAHKKCMPTSCSRTSNNPLIASRYIPSNATGDKMVQRDVRRCKGVCLLRHVAHGCTLGT